MQVHVIGAMAYTYAKNQDEKWLDAEYDISEMVPYISTRSRDDIWSLILWAYEKKTMILREYARLGGSVSDVVLEGVIRELNVTYERLIRMERILMKYYNQMDEN